MVRLTVTGPLSLFRESPAESRLGLSALDLWPVSVLNRGFWVFYFGKSLYHSKGDKSVHQACPYFVKHVCPLCLCPARWHEEQRGVVDPWCWERSLSEQASQDTRWLLWPRKNNWPVWLVNRPEQLLLLPWRHGALIQCSPVQWGTSSLFYATPESIYDTRQRSYFFSCWLACWSVCLWE